MGIDLSNTVLGIILSVGIYEADGVWKTHFPFGRILSAMASSLKIYIAQDNTLRHHLLSHTHLNRTILKFAQAVSKTAVIKVSMSQ